MSKAYISQASFFRALLRNMRCILRKVRSYKISLWLRHWLTTVHFFFYTPEPLARLHLVTPEFIPVYVPGSEQSAMGTAHIKKSGK